jgi:uncharacterized protein with FMN-binding domain
MRRTLLILAVTGVALGLLLTFKTTALHAPGSVPQAATPPPSSEPRRSSGTPSRSITGPVEENRWGPVQVKVTFTGSRISDIQALQVPSHTTFSQQVNAYAVPILRKEALRAQSAQIDVVSGATYTSDGYRQSLQAAIDAHHG